MYAENKIDVMIVELYRSGFESAPLEKAKSATEWGTIIDGNGK